MGACRIVTSWSICMVASSLLLGNRTPIVGPDATLRHPSTGGRTDSRRPWADGVDCAIWPRTVKNSEEERPRRVRAGGVEGSSLRRALRPSAHVTDRAQQPQPRNLVGVDDRDQLTEWLGAGAPEECVEQVAPPRLGPRQHLTKLPTGGGIELRDPCAKAGVFVELRRPLIAAMKGRTRRQRLGLGSDALFRTPSDHQFTLKCAPPASMSTAIDPTAITILRTSFMRGTSVSWCWEHEPARWDLARPPVSATGDRESRDRPQDECDTTHQLHRCLLSLARVNVSMTVSMRTPANASLTSG